MTRSVEKEEYWRLVVDEHAASGLSIRKFCQREAVAEASFYFWRKELTRRDTDALAGHPQPAMVPVEVVEPSPVTRDRKAKAQTQGDRDAQSLLQPSVVEVTVPGGFILRAPATIHADHVSVWLAAIAKVAAS